MQHFPRPPENPRQVLSHHPRRERGGRLSSRAMSDFAEVLRFFREGERTAEQLLAEIDHQIEEEHADAVTLLAILYEEHAAAELPAPVYVAIEKRILQWLHQYNVVRNDPHAEIRDASTTVVIDIPGVEPEQRTTAEVGDVLQGRFRLIERIGEGGMSRVYKAIDLRKVEARSPDPYVAVKVLTIPVGAYSRALVLLQREAQKLQSLSHPNIVRVSDCDRDGKTVFMTMEYLAGESLHSTFQTQAFAGLDSQTAVGIIEKVGAALAVAHGSGIVHGDLKPGNVLITGKGEVKVIDFGIARVVNRTQSVRNDDSQPQEEWEELTALTPAYASPEMLEKKEPDPRDDIYGLACIAYEILTGEHPFQRHTAIIARDASMVPPRNEKVSRRQYKAILRGLDFDRGRRTPNVQQFLDEFTGASGAGARRAIAILGIGSAVLLAGLYAFSRLEPAEEVRQTSPLVPVSNTLATGDIFRDCPTCPLMRVLPPGRFVQGSGPEDVNAEPFEQPQRTVEIPHALGIGAYEVTVGEFRDFIEATGRIVVGCSVYDGEWKHRDDLSWSKPGFAQTAAHPVTCVSWQDAGAYAEWLSIRTRHLYRLPSASEWEYAGRAGAESSRPWGADASSACSNANVADQDALETFPGWRVHPCSDHSTFTAPAGSFTPNRFGLYDMLGNVAEWVEDCWHADYVNAPVDGGPWSNTGCTARELRGGSWFTTPKYVRLPQRNRFEDTYRSSSIGFRVVRTIGE